ncbi:MAG: peptide chain release factor family protein [Pirellulaceae bacterium]
MHPAEWDPAELAAVCHLRRGRRSGPGGQHRNKVETAVVLIHPSSGVRAEASERRSQYANRRVALFRLRVNLALALRTPRDREAGPTARWQRRCHAGRLRVSSAHEDFPALLAEALDVLEACQYDIPSAAQQLATTASQLVRFLAGEPRALEQVNRQRAACGLRPLRA